MQPNFERVPAIFYEAINEAKAAKVAKEQVEKREPGGVWFIRDGHSPDRYSLVATQKELASTV